MHDAEHELSQNESAVEITPLPAENELPSEMENKSAAPVERAHRSGAWRYILTAVVTFLALAFLLVNVVQLPHQSSKQSSHSGSPGAASTANPNSTYVPTEYSVNTTIVNGVAYVGAANGAVYALRSSNGSLLWRHKINPGAGAAPLVDSGIVYITAGMNDAGPGYLYALRASDGVELWRYTSSDTLPTPKVANGIVYVTSNDFVSQNGGLVALRASNGAQLWHDTTRGSLYNSLVVDNKVVYASTSGDNGPGMVYALRASDGTHLWRYPTTTFTTVQTVDNGIAYLFSDQGLSALLASNGRLRWRAAVEGNNSGLPSQVIDGVLYLVITKISLESNIYGGVSTVYAVRISDGAILWHYTMSKENGNNWANWLSIENSTIYAGTFVDQDKSYIYALRSSDGSMLWRQAMHRGMSANAFVANGVIYIASFVNDGSLNQGSGAVYALRASDGTQLWYHPMYWVVYNPPMLVGGTIYISTGGGDLYAFQASSGSMLWHFHTDIQ